MNLGQIPYLDVFDHKGPLIYFINAIGLFLSGGTSIGVWFVELIFLLLSVLICFEISNKTFGTLPAFFGTLLFIISLENIALSNLTETYAIFFEFLALWAYWRFLTTKKFIFIFIIGFTTSCCFLLRPNIIGIALGIVISLLIFIDHKNKWKNVGQRIISYILGFIFPLIPIIIYFSNNQAINRLCESVFLFNLKYSDFQISNWISTAFTGQITLSQSGIFLPALIGAFCIVFLSRSDSIKLRFLLASFFSLILEMALSSMSGYPFLHYFATWLPPLAFLSSFFGYILIKNTVLIKFSEKWPMVRFGKLTVGIGVLLLSVNFIGFNSIRYIWKLEPSAPSKQTEIINFIRENTESNDYVLFWGAATTFNFLTSRQSPSRFVYQTPLFTNGYSSEAIVDEFLTNLIEKKPEYIIDASSSESKIFPPINLANGMEWLNQHNYFPEGIKDILFFINDNYQNVATLGSDNWVVYKFVSD